MYCTAYPGMELLSCVLLAIPATKCTQDTEITEVMEKNPGGTFFHVQITARWVAHREKKEGWTGDFRQKTRRGRRELNVLC
jgi:hypothetical protein